MPSAPAEIYPRLNRGATHIVYASNASGDYDIWSMPVNAQYPGRLTSHPANDDDPVWSPNGRKIAFTSFHDGPSELYVMNADGSGQTRLTYNNAYESNTYVFAPMARSSLPLPCPALGRQSNARSPEWRAPSCAPRANVL